MEPINSRSEVLLSLWFISYAFVRLHCQTPTFPPPSPIDGGDSSSELLPAKRNLVFQLVDLFSYGPLSSQKPSPKKGDTIYFILKPRSVFTSSLSILSQFRYRLLSFVRRLQTDENALVLLWMYKISLRTLPLDSPRLSEHERLSFTKKGFMSPSPNYLRTLPLKSSRITSHGFRRVKKNGIMIPFSRRGGYRSFFMPYSPYSLIAETTYMQICYFRKELHSPKSLKPRSGLVILLQTGYKPCVELLNLHGRRGFHAREKPPVMLRSCTYPFRILVIASPRNLSLSNVSSLSYFHAEYKQHALITTSTCYDLSKLNSHSSTTLAINLNRWSNITLAQTLVKALPRVVLLVPARSTSLAPSQTPFRLLTLANQSFFDSLLEDLLIILDLTCIKKLHSSWFKALKNPLSTNRFYHFISFMLALGSALSCCILNFGISDSSYLCTWFLL